MSDGRPALLLVDDERAYYARYLESIAGPTPVVLPVLTRTPGVVRSLIAAAGEREAPAPAGPPAAWATAAAEGLAAAVERCDLAAVEAIHRAERERHGRPEGLPGAYVVGVGRAAGLAALRALATGRELALVERLDDDRIRAIGERARSLHVVALDLAYSAVQALQRALDARAEHEVLPGTRGCPVGYLHARTFETMTLLDAKHRLGPAPGSPTEDVVVDCFLKQPPTDLLPGLVAVPYQNLSRATIADRPAMGVLAITSHGMGDLVHLNRDYLCGRSPYLGAVPTRSRRLPSCTEEGGGCFYKRDGSALHAHAVPAQHIFINTCSSLRLHEGEFDPLFSISYSAMEGRARSFVGSLRWKDGRGSEGLLYRHLLRRGFTLGEAVLLVNRSLRANELEATEDVYCLFGDPEERLASQTPVRAGEPVTGGRARIRLEEGFRALEIDSPALVAAFHDAALTIEPRTDRPVFVTIVPTRARDRLHVFAFSYEAIPTDVTLEMWSAGDLVDRLRDSYEVVERNLSPWLGMNRLYPERVRQGGRKNLANRMVNVTELARRSFAEPTLARKLRISCDRLWEDIDRMDAEVAASLAEAIRQTSFRFSERYQDFLRLREDGSSDPCPVCGTPTTHRTVEHMLCPSLRRTEVLCPACGGIQDRPDDALSLEILVDEHWRRRTTGRVTLRLRSRAARRRQGYALLAVRRSGEYEMRPAEPTRPAAVEAGGSTDVRFDLAVGDDVPVHHYMLFAGFVWSTQIYLATRSFWVGAA